MEARNKKIEDWFAMIKQGQLVSLRTDVVRQRLESHLVPYDALIADDYDAFLAARADLIHADMFKLCEGASPQ